MKYYCISDHCRWVKGAVGSSIYDLKNQRVYPIDTAQTMLIAKALSNQELSSNECVSLDLLVASGLLNDHASPVVDYRVQPSLRYAWLELTNRCNCKCIHCYGAFGLPTMDTIKHELTTREWKEVIDQLDELHCDAIQLIGGEPLIHPGFQEILEYAAQKHFKRTDIFTNAFLLTDALADVIAKAKASVRVSLYGYDSASHDTITQNPGSFTRLDHSIDLLNERHIPVAVAVVLMRENQDNLEKIKAYIKSKSLTYTGFDTVRTVAHSPQASHSVTNKEVAKERIMRKPPSKTSAYQFSLNRQWNSCWYGKFAITAVGDVLPCIFARDLSCGNIRTDSKSLIREKLLTYWKITKDQIETCKDCEYRYACDDCRPLAMGEGFGIMGKYPRCSYVPDICQWQEL